MAADAVGLHDPFHAFADLNGLRHPARIEDDHIHHAVQGLPEIVDGHVFVGKMTVHAPDGAVRTHVKPGFIMRFHHMAGCAEKRSFRLGQ